MTWLRYGFGRKVVVEGTDTNLRRMIGAGTATLAIPIGATRLSEIYEDYVLEGNDHKLATLVMSYRRPEVMRVDPWECLVFFILWLPGTRTFPNKRMEGIAKEFSTGDSLSENGPHGPFPSPEIDSVRRKGLSEDGGSCLSR